MNQYFLRLNVEQENLSQRLQIHLRNVIEQISAQLSQPSIAKGRQHWHDHISLPVICAVDEGYLTSCLKLPSGLSVMLPVAHSVHRRTLWLMDQQRGRICTGSHKADWRRFTVWHVTAWKIRKGANGLLAPGLYTWCEHDVCVFVALAADVTQSKSRSFATTSDGRRERKKDRALL